MKVSPSLLLIVLVLLGHVIHADNPENCTVSYKKAFAIFDASGIKLLPKSDIDKAINGFTVFYSHDENSVTKDIIDQLREGFELSMCDWNTDFSGNGAIILPYVSHVGRLTDFAFSYSIDCFQNYRRAESCDVLLYTMTLARRVSCDKLLVLNAVSYEQQTKGLLISRNILNALDQQETIIFYERWKKMPKTAEMADVILFERNRFINKLKNDPVAFFRMLDSTTISGGMAGYKHNANTVSDIEKKVAINKAKEVRYDLIDAYYKDCSEAVALPPRDAQSRLASLYKNIDTIESQSHITAKILRELSPAFSVYYEQKCEFNKLESEIIDMFEKQMK